MPYYDSNEQPSSYARSGGQRQVRKAEPARKSAPQGGRQTPQGAGRSRAGRRASGGCLGGMLYFIFVIGAAAVLATFGWVSANEVLGLVKPNTTAVIVVSEDDGISDIAGKLKDEGIIKYPLLFKIYGGLSHAQKKIDPGTYELKADLDYRAIVYAMRSTSSYRATVWVTIPEGMELKQIFALLDEKGVCKTDELAKAASEYDFSYSYIKALPHGEKRLEGYLFPDTYEFYINESASSALGKMLSNFDSKLTAELRKRAQDMDMSIHQAVILASLIEKEAANDSERAVISSVIHNRLESKKYPYLQIDAAIQYALPERKEVLSIEDTKIDSPYNTYTNKGLPAGPIASPGAASIKAALYPEDTSYYFYALGLDGKHKFSKTISEHEAFLATLK